MGKQVSVMPDLPAPMPTAFPRCHECGNIHPSTSGGCPVAKGATKKNDKINVFVDRISQLLYDNDSDGTLIQMLNKTIQAWQIKQSKKLTSGK